jgi:hypothetical protein
MVPTGADGLVRLDGTTLLKIAGIGAKRALAASELLIAEGATALLSWGSGGALHPKLSPGNLIIPKSVIASQKDVFPTDADWHNRLVARLKNRLEIHSEPLAQSPSVLASPVEKLNFSNQNAAIAVDMESGSVAEMASRANLPFMAIRAIADTADMAIPASALNAIELWRQWYDLPDTISLPFNLVNHSKIPNPTSHISNPKSEIRNLILCDIDLNVPLCHTSRLTLQDKESKDRWPKVLES